MHQLSSTLDRWRPAPRSSSRSSAASPSCSVGTRIAASLLSVVMIGALIYVKQDLGIISSGPMPGAELDLALLAGLIALIVLGPGGLSLDDRLGVERRTSADQRELVHAS